MAILSTTLCYPNPANPGNGAFVRRRLKEIHKRLPVRVVAPLPHCPPIRRRPEIPAGDARAEPPVHWPAMFYIPGVLKSLDAYFYADCLNAAIDADLELAASRLIDAHFVWPDGVGAWLVARQRRMPFVCTIRGKIVSQARFPSRRRKIADMLRDADRLIAVSQSLADVARDVADRDLEIAVIPNGVDTAIFQRTAPATQSRGFDESARIELGWSNDRPHIVAVGHLQRLKGFHRLIDAWPAVTRRHAGARLVLVGGPANEPAWERSLRQRATIVNAGHDPRNPPITFAGRQPADQIARILNAADAFALTSDSEGWCNAIAEALACGCPVVATDVGGNREQLGNDIASGRLVPLDDRDALVAAIDALLSDPPDRSEIARRGARRSWRQVGAECVDVYETLPP
ncbi:MAG TPA: glycosyltransferase [Phycisphaerae bacterium]|mgnify:CR=1 FL=1|nr:glycosyltransferase [Phycisphaerae bacterium]HRW55169.1 glycosyltransferase [Phycisphaerae bacterium]